MSHSPTLSRSLFHSLSPSRSRSLPLPSSLSHSLSLSLSLQFSFSSYPLDHCCSLESSRCFSSQICWVQFNGRSGQLGSRAIKFGYFQQLHLILLRLFGNIVTHNPKAASSAEPLFFGILQFSFSFFLNSKLLIT